jgi:translation initiation factor 2-alpha kinase 4
MAPPKTPRNRKQSDVFTPQVMPPGAGKPAKQDQSRESPMALQPSEALARVQEDEREVLKAIYMDDYEEIEAKGAWSVRYLVAHPVVEHS